MEKRIAVFPGSFDPITKGHENIIHRGLLLFDEIIIGIGSNATKKYHFPEEQRERFIRNVFGTDSRIKIMRYSGLTVNFCRDNQARFILRGIRSVADYEFEKPIAQMNHSMAPSIETIFIVSEPALSHISSTIVRDILVNKGDISQFVPNGVNK